MQPENANITPATPSPPADCPQVDLAAGGADDETIECALAQVEHRLEAWSEALEARAAQLAEAQDRLGQQERSLEQAQHSSTESRQQLETDQHRTNERDEARLRELDERQAELDARVAELDQRQQQLDAREARLARQEVELADSIQAFEERQAAAEAPTAEPADTEPASESDIEPDAHDAQKERVLLPRGDEAQTEAQDASEDKPVVAVPAAVLPDQPEPVQPPGSVGPPVMEPRTQAAADEPRLSDDSSEAGLPIADEPTAGQAVAASLPAAGEPPAASGPPPAGQSPAADEPPVADDIPSVDLDPDIARKLRVLRRLAGPSKSDAELLAQLAAREPNEDPQEKSSKRWWKRGR